MRRALVICILGLCAATAFGIPKLQLDIGGGVYDPAPAENVVATQNPFTLYALFNTLQGKASGTYYLSAAIVPKTANPPVTSFGSFKINGTEYSAGNMIYGNPPESVTRNSLDLPAHGIFDTHYIEIGFVFDKNNRAQVYNSQDNPGGFVQDSAGAIIFEDFTVDVSGLSAGYQVHFDLYNLGTDKRGNLMVKDKAPFSHDAQSGPLTVGDTSSTMILLGMAMLAIEGLRRRFLR
jgi:hypothetical protein